MQLFYKAIAFVSHVLISCRSRVVSCFETSFQSGRSIVRSFFMVHVQIPYSNDWLWATIRKLSLSSKIFVCVRMLIFHELFMIFLPLGCHLCQEATRDKIFFIFWKLLWNMISEEPTFNDVVLMVSFEFYHRNNFIVVYCSRVTPLLTHDCDYFRICSYPSPNRPKSHFFHDVILFWEDKSEIRSLSKIKVMWVSKRASCVEMMRSIIDARRTMNLSLTNIK